jgi:hypothetical protein
MKITPDSHHLLGEVWIDPGVPGDPSPVLDRTRRLDELPKDRALHQNRYRSSPNDLVRDTAQEKP